MNALRAALAAVALAAACQDPVPPVAVAPAEAPRPLLLDPASLRLEPEPFHRPAGFEGEPPRVEVRFDETSGELRIGVEGEPVTVFHTRGRPHPYGYPLLGPGGVPLTRGYPVDPRADEARDHPHHLSLWFAHGSVGGEDFWHPAADPPARIELLGAPRTFSGRGLGGFEARHRWVASGGRVLAEDELLFLLFPGADGSRLLSFRWRIRPAGAPLRFGDTKEGTFALRLNPSLRLEGPVAAGRARTATGVEGAAVWGERAPWISYWGPARRRPGDREAPLLGVTLLDHPDNLRHPTWWHARTYGLVAANPFGRHDFEGAPEGSGDFVLPEDSELVLRYGLYLHRGGPEEAGAGEVWRAWAASVP